MNEADKVADELHALNFYLQRNIRYHMRRAAFFTRWSRFTSFVGVFAGSAAAAAFISKLPIPVGAGLAALVALAAAIELVVGVGQLAWRHFDLRKRYLEIEEHLEAEETGLDDIRGAWRSIRRIEADEPPTMSALELMVRNDVICSMYEQKDRGEHFIPIPWYMTLTAHWIDWDVSQREPKPRPQAA